MIHYKQLHAPSTGNGKPVAVSSRHHACFAAMEASISAIRKAKRAADESLQRGLEASRPHVTTNTIFLALTRSISAIRQALFATNATARGRTLGNAVNRCETRRD